MLDIDDLLPVSNAKYINDPLPANVPPEPVAKVIASTLPSRCTTKNCEIECNGAN